MKMMVTKMILSRVKWLDTGFGLVIRFIGLLQTVTTSNCNRFTNTYIHFTIHYGTHSFLSINTRVCLATDLNNVLSFRAHIPAGWLPSLLTISSHSRLPCHDSLFLFESQNYPMTNLHSASLSWCRAPSGAQDKIFITAKQLRVCWCGAPSLMRGRTCHLKLLLVLTNAVILGSESHGSHDHHILLSQIREFPNLEGHVHVFISPRNRVAQLYAQPLGSFFVASYDFQCYGGGGGYSTPAPSGGSQPFLSEIQSLSDLLYDWRLSANQSSAESISKLR
jgi:hypothetical protein